MKTLFLGILPIVGALLGLLFFAFVMNAARLDRDRGFKNAIRPDEVHHAYLGVLLTAGSFLQLLEHLTIAVVPVGWLLAPALRWVGVVLIWDDDYEHTMQLGGQASYKSAIHRFADITLFRVPGVTWPTAQDRRHLACRSGRCPAAGDLELWWIRADPEGPGTARYGRRGAA